MDRERADHLREGTRRAYSAAADNPQADHPFPVGIAFALTLGYPPELITRLPGQAFEAFSGVSNVSMLAELPVGSTVLDLGCGAGLDALIAAERMGPDGRVLGVDFSGSMLGRAQKAAEAAGAEGVTFYQADGERLPLSERTIDVCMVNGIFNLNPRREALFQELARVVRRGGKVFAAELILRAPLPSDVRVSEADWFA